MRAEYIDREAAITAMWKALYEYEDKTEKQFKEEPELDLYDWFIHRIFVQATHAIMQRTIHAYSGGLFFYFDNLSTVYFTGNTENSLLKLIKIS